MLTDKNTTVTVEPVQQLEKKVVFKRKIKKLTAEEIQKKRDNYEREQKEAREKYVPPTDEEIKKYNEEIKKYREEQEPEEICGRVSRYGEICNNTISNKFYEYCGDCMKQELGLEGDDDDCYFGEYY